VTAVETASVRPLTGVNERDLCSMAAAGDGRALEELYDRYSRLVMSFASRMLSEPAAAEDLTQEVFFRAWKQADAYASSKGSFATWILSITRNMAIDELRKRNRRPQLAELDDPIATIANVEDTQPSVEEHAWIGMVRFEIQNALGALPDAQRQPIELAYYRGLTQREVAEALGVPLGTIKTRIRLGMRKLRDHLEERKVEVG
jgi:RNA polymerase sigma-70 factor, ECF subfamily